MTIMAQPKSIYDYTVTTIDGKPFSFSSLRGKKIIIVNTASKCGNTKQYEQLEELYKIYLERKVVVIGFPANNFGKQEPGTNAQIAEFCEKNYGVTFPMMAKISVKGDDMAPIYQWLTKKELNGVKDSEVEWNFQKYLIDKNGNLADIVDNRENPLDKHIVNWIEGK